MIRVNSIHKTVLQIVPTRDVPTAKILRDRVIHFREHDEPQSNRKRVATSLLVQQSPVVSSQFKGLVSCYRLNWFRE